jgi:hypothetical protein
MEFPDAFVGDICGTALDDDLILAMIWAGVVADPCVLLLLRVLPHP